jgi:nucleoside-diphosphate-sugar epimerase
MMLVTGANGFVGRGVLSAAARRGIPVRGAVRRPPDSPVQGTTYRAGLEIEAVDGWAAALADVDVIVHAAARVHRLKDEAADPLAEYRRINVAGTMNVARQAAGAGVRRFVFLSSVKVHGERTLDGRPFSIADSPAPVDAYAVSKNEAEVALRQFARETGLEVVIVRPVIVYGPGVKANFAMMMRWLRRGVPLPFGAIHNQRSFVAVRNLADLILTCAEHPGAVGETFLASDGEDLSTTSLLRRLAAALRVRARLIPVPATALQLGARAFGRPEIARRLCDSLRVDIGFTRDRLGWTPLIGVDDELRATAESYLLTADAP